MFVDFTKIICKNLYLCFMIEALMGKRKIFYKKKSKSKAMKLIRTGHCERTQSHSSSASIDEESVASFQNEPPLNQRNVEDQGRKYGRARQPPCF